MLRVSNFFLRLTFSLLQRLGLHITPNSYYQPIPDTRELEDKLWQRESELVGIDINDAKQLDLLNQFLQYKTEYDRIPLEKTNTPEEYYINNGGFQFVDGEILYCMIRHFKPRKIIEIGSGNSTYLSAQAILKNNNDCKLVAIEPFPNEILGKGFPGLSQLIIRKVQEIPMSEFKSLEANDILFIDSSHVMKIGSDVQYEYLEILPRLKPGVIVHVHDIFLPVEYPKNWIKNFNRFWNEQYVLQAFLTFNSHFEVLWAGSYMRHKHTELLKGAFKSYRNGIGPASFWMRVQLQSSKSTDSDVKKVRV